MWFGSWTYTKQDLNLTLAFDDGEHLGHACEESNKSILISSLPKAANAVMSTHFCEQQSYISGLDLSTFHSDFKDVSQWAIERTVAERQVLPESEELGPQYAVLTYTLELKRNMVFASYILTLPCVFLACLTLVVFWLPPDRPDRTSLGEQPHQTLSYGFSRSSRQRIGFVCFPHLSFFGAYLFCSDEYFCELLAAAPYLGGSSSTDGNFYPIAG